MAVTEYLVLSSDPCPACAMRSIQGGWCPACRGTGCVLVPFEEAVPLTVQKAVEQEREVCARLCETDWPASTIEEREAGADLAAKIRARGQEEVE